MLANVLVYAPHLSVFDTLSEHSKTTRTEKLSSLYQETKLGLIIQRGIWIPYCFNPHFSQHDSDKQRLRGGLVKCQRMTMRLLKLQPAIWINVQKDSTCFHPSETRTLKQWPRDWHITGCHLPLICCEKEEHVWLSWPTGHSVFTSVWRKHCGMWGSLEAH